MIKHPNLPPDEDYTPEERGVDMEDMILKRADEIRKKRAKESKVEAKKQRRRLVEELRHARMLSRCRTCHAMKFYLKMNGKKPPK